ncbi:MAG: thiamine-phosphate kinase [Deltaproteobacteria bacterium]|nr:thiamine-phosphate kinase [Deltaproteobacteria bacterium]
MTTELQLIDRFLSPFARKGAGMVLGPGDDCAVLRASNGTDQCVTTDALVEGVHFTSELFSDADIGHKALAVNLSDLAAMGAVPRWFVCSVACRASDAARVPRIARGMAALAARAGILLAGGNFSRADTLSLHITAGGEVPRGTALTRSGAKAGDLIYVTGTFGDAALALALRSLQRQNKAVLLHQLRPEPRLAVGLIARRHAHAAIDVSDGLLQDLGHVLEASGVGAHIDAHLVPVSQTFRDVAANLDLALTGGEDYELALFIPAAKASAFERECERVGQKVSCIGAAVKGGGLSVDHAPHLKRGGFDHFAGVRNPA